MRDLEKIDNIAILMATYNGEPYIRQQIDSILEQTVERWTLYVHDDGSTDNTKEILNEYSSRYPKIQVLDYEGTHGAKNNFLGLLARVDADYYLFADQDDVWRKDKIEIELKKAKSIEDENKNVPILIYSDLEVVNSNLERISDNSMWKLSGVCPKLLSSFNTGAVFEYVTGCTMLFNSLARASVVYPADAALMHDSWVTCCVLRQNGIVYGISQLLVRYRQHDNNALGASDYSSRNLYNKMSHLSIIYRNNRRHWRMLQALGYGSFAKYLWYKYINRYYKVWKMR